MSTESRSIISNWDADYEQTLRKQVEFTPNNSVALFSLGRLLRLTNRFKEAEFYLKQAIEANGDLSSWLELLMLYNVQGLFKCSDSVRETIESQFGLRLSSTCGDERRRHNVS
jgi:uncharacterized protein HemY